MESVEQRKQKVISMIELLKGELDNLKALESGQSCVGVGTGSDRYMYLWHSKEGGNGKG
jgi:hypothetical protein